MSKKHKNPQTTPPPSVSSEAEASQPEEPITSIENSDFSDEELQLSEPTENPPGMLLAENDDEEGFGAGIWYSNKKITALWTINQTRNSWAGISGLGWRKIATVNNSSTVALTMLAAHAKDRNRNVKLKIDNNRIVELYVW